MITRFGVKMILENLNFDPPTMRFAVAYSRTLEHFSITLIDKTDPSDQLKIEDYWRH